MNITKVDFRQLYKKAQSIPFLLSQASSTNVTEFVSSYASALGCSEKVFFLPLLTCVAACMGTDCCVEISNSWQEPTILWTFVLTPKSILRVDVAEHLKQELLRVQDEIFSVNEANGTDESFKKFIFDMCTLDQLQNMLKLNNGHGCGIYNSIRPLHKHMVAPEQADIMHRLHYGRGLFKDCQGTKRILNKTRVNLTVISTPTLVRESLSSVPHFQELFYQCFLTTCAEEKFVKFSELTVEPETDKLREIFRSLITLHSGRPIVYKLGIEATDKFEQIHDDLSNKARHLTGKIIDYNCFESYLSYIGRLSCVLHVLDTIIVSINNGVVISQFTWNTEISATTVEHARKLLDHISEQRRDLIINIPSDKQPPPPIIT